MADKYYSIPENPKYSIDDIRELQNSDPVNAQTIVNPLVLRILENIAAVKKQSTNAVISPTPPDVGPALWFCSDPTWRPEKPEPEEMDVTLDLGDPENPGSAAVFAEIDGVAYPIRNAEGEPVGSDEYNVTFTNQ